MSLQKNRTHIIRPAILILVGLSLTMSCTNDSTVEGRVAEPPVAARVQMPETRTLESKISYVGTVFATQEVQLISRVQGTLTGKPVPKGGSFEKGDLLANLDSPEMEAAVERLRAEADYWCRRHETDKRLVEEGALAREQAESSERACRSARAGLAEAEAQLAKTVLEAPFSGQVLDWLAEPGQPLMPGQPILLIGDGKREVRVDVVEEDLARGVTVGTIAEIRSEGVIAASSQVTEISPVSSGPARAFSVTIPIPSQMEQMPRKGASLRVDFVLKREPETLAVPVSALLNEEGESFVYLIADGVARKQQVLLGLRQGGWAAVEFPWNGKDPVAVTNLRGLSDGAEVYAVTQEGEE